MIRYVAPSPEAAQALMDSTSTLLVVEGEVAFEPWRHCTTGCEATGSCPVCNRPYPPAGRSVPMEAANGYCEHECEGWDDDRRRSKHLWPGELAQLERQAPADYVRATKPCERCNGRGCALPPGTTIGRDALATAYPCPACDGEGQERIGIYVTCPTCEGEPCDRCNGSGKQIEQHDYASEVVACGWCYGEPCTDCTDGLVLVGDVLAFVVLPITVDYIDDDNEAPCPNVPHLFVGRDRIGGEYEWHLTYCDGPGGEDPRDHELAYHDPASLPGKYGVTVTDARRAQ